MFVGIGLLYRVGLAPTPRIPETTAVVCIECQNGILGPDSVLPALAGDGAALIDNVRRLQDAAGRFGAKVVHATYEGNLGGQAIGTAPLWRALGALTDHWTPDSPETSVVAELLAPTDVVLVGVSLNLAVTQTAGHVAKTVSTSQFPATASVARQPPMPKTC